MCWGGVRWGGVRWGGVRWGGVHWGGVHWGGVRWGALRWGGVRWAGLGWAESIKELNTVYFRQGLTLSWASVSSHWSTQEYTLDCLKQTGLKKSAQNVSL